MTGTTKPLLSALKKEQPAQVPIWLMRQAGRYLPEYRKIRAHAGSFLVPIEAAVAFLREHRSWLVPPEFAVEVTLQPIHRFSMDGAILFSDILVVPFALGQTLWFEEGKGPRLEALERPEDIGRLEPTAVEERLSPVFEALRGVRTALPPSTTLIGFAGAPWTVASYMVEGGSSSGFVKAKAWAYRDPETFTRLIDLLVEVTANYLIRQVENGAEVLQLFDSWAGVWPAPQMRRWCLVPSAEIIKRVKKSHPEVPIILFPRGAGQLYQVYAEEAAADALGLDTSVPLAWARDKLQGKVALQGNLDPVHLLAGGPGLEECVSSILAALRGGPFVFNLGHGILPETPVEHVEKLIEIVRS